MGVCHSALAVESGLQCHQREKIGDKPEIIALALGIQ